MFTLVTSLNIFHFTTKSTIRYGVPGKSRLEKVEIRKLQLVGTGERLMISDSYNRHNARSPVPAGKNLLFAGDSGKSRSSVPYYYTKTSTINVYPKNFYSLNQAQIRHVLVNTIHKNLLKLLLLTMFQNRLIS